MHWRFITYQEQWIASGLLEAGGDDVGDVDEDVAPGVGRGEFELARLCAVGFLMIPDLEIAVRGGWATQ